VQAERGTLSGPACVRALHMDREKKAVLVEEIAAQLTDAGAIFAVDYRGIGVSEAAELRARLAESDATLRIVKNRLAKRAAESAGTEQLGSLFEGPTALTLVQGDPVTAAKTIADFAREHRVPTYKGGIMDGAPLEPEQFTRIARLPGLEVLQGQLIGVVASPVTGLARGLNQMLAGLASQLGQMREQGLVSGEADGPAAEEPAADGPAAEEPAADGPAEEAEDSAGDESDQTSDEESEEA
jgi:large subunit ribosomal protein L10